MLDLFFFHGSSSLFVLVATSLWIWTLVRVKSQLAQHEKKLREIQARIDQLTRLEQREIHPPIAPVIPPPIPVRKDLEDTYLDAEPPPLPAAFSAMSAQPNTAEKPDASSDMTAVERFMGGKLFAWLGGVALFFGVLFFVRYAFERNLIPPSVRVSLGFLAGIGMLLGGQRIVKQARFRVLAQAITATGVLILYGVTFAAHAIYKFPVFSSLSTFVLMAMVTILAMLMAMRMQAQPIAYLGMVGGFCVPLLLPEALANLPSLFVYGALLDAGLLFLAHKNAWNKIFPSAAIGTAMLELSWCFQQFNAQEYDNGLAYVLPLMMAIILVALFVTAARTYQTVFPESLLPTVTAIMMLGFTAFFAFPLLKWLPKMPLMPWIVYGFLLILNAFAWGISRSQKIVELGRQLLVLLTYLHLWIWIHEFDNPEWHYLSIIAVVTLAIASMQKPHGWRTQSAADASANHTALGFALPPIFAIFLLSERITVASSVSEYIWPWTLVMLLLLAWIDSAFGATKPRYFWLPLLGVFSTLILELRWLDQHFNPAAPYQAMVWFMVLHGAFLLYPWIFRPMHLANESPWLAAMVSSLTHFYVFYQMIVTAFPNALLFPLPLLFAAVSLLLFWRLYRTALVENLPIIRGGFASLSVLFLFVGLNFAIADYFRPDGYTFVALEFGSNFARDMAYSIGWGLFALGLFGLGFRFSIRRVRYVAIVLLGITLVKLFFHDLAQLESIYRIIALVAVALMAFITSYFYQRHDARNSQNKADFPS